MNRRLQAYKRVHVSTASPGDLIVMLFDGMIKNVHVAGRALAAQLFADAGNSMDKALAIIGHLREVLNPQQAPELAASLDRTYAVWSMALVRAMAQRDGDSLEQIIDQMRGLRDAFAAAQGHGMGRAAGA